MALNYLIAQNRNFFVVVHERYVASWRVGFPPLWLYGVWTERGFPFIRGNHSKAIKPDLCQADIHFFTDDKSHSVKLKLIE